MAEVATTQRAYTLRLRGVDPRDHSWREKLWKTHEAVNKGAKVFGDWILTLRGGLSHELVDMKVKGKKGVEREPTPKEKSDRRIVLALSWLSVESEKGPPDRYVVATGKEPETERRRKTVEALKKILQKRGLSAQETEKWIEDCSPSLSAAIRDDAVWVNRNALFATVSFTQEDIWDMLERFIGRRERYLAPVEVQETEGEGEESVEEGSKDLVQKAGQWLSSRFGTGEGADFRKLEEICIAIASWAKKAQPGKGRVLLDNIIGELAAYDVPFKNLQGIRKLLSYAGCSEGNRNLLDRLDTEQTVSKGVLDEISVRAQRQAERHKSKIGGKGERAYANMILKDVERACGFTYRRASGRSRHPEFSVMLDHAARRVSSTHTWIKRAEAERRRFEADSKKISNVPNTAKEWLDAFCRERSLDSNALDGYRVRNRAIDGWKELVNTWSQQNCRNEEDRISLARALQDSPDVDKFGDIQLFEALASDDAMCVWMIQGKPSSQPLIDYVEATDAEAKRLRFKVPAYCHPDAFLHPVFCDFGYSRWPIKFNVHESHISQSKKRKTAFDSNLRGLTMGLFWGRDTVKDVGLCWQSKKLIKDLALPQSSSTEDLKPVSRADRLGLAAGRSPENESVAIIGVFEQKYWNGRLQALRSQLDAIAKIDDNRRLSRFERDRRKDKLISNIKWFVTLSARLTPQGPWYDYVNEATEKSPFQRKFKSGGNKGQTYVSLTGWPFETENSSRSGMSRLILSRLPGLRVLSVDLGHRYAAACAVWETITSQQMKQACDEAGHAQPSADSMYLHLKTDGKTTIYRRIGPDELDGKPHPAPWGKLDRQFLIKLPGEEREARMATVDEIWQVHELERELGRNRPLIDRLRRSGWGTTDEQREIIEELKRKGWKPLESKVDAVDGEEFARPSLSVDELMSATVNTVRLGLRRHGDRARIAHYLVTDKRATSGGREEALDETGRVELITDALALWHGLANSSRWLDSKASALWKEHFPKLELAEGDDKEKTRQQIKKEQKDFRERVLVSIANELAKNPSLCMKLHAQWAAQWYEENDLWKKRLRWLRDWILPRGRKVNEAAIRRVGGLSLTRIATMKSLYQAQKAFYTRMTPKGRQIKDGVPVTADEDFGKSVSNAIEKMREQRVKQLASRIVEAALGVGSENPKHWERGRRRPRGPLFAPCHAVVIENLKKYKTKETRTRRENRMLAVWSQATFRKLLAEGCQLHGLHLREVSAGYTSRQDSRTGAPGIRCQDVSVNEFLESRFWRGELTRARKRLDEGKGDPRDRYICDLYEKWSQKGDKDRRSALPLRIPHRGGDIFVSADSEPPASKGLQTDLNAAANIGLKALLDLDWQGAWWYVPCDSREFKPVKDRVGGSTVMNLNKPLKNAETESGEDKNATRKKKSKKKERDVVNLWRDVSAKPLAEGTWQDTVSYHSDVQIRVIKVLRRQAGLEAES